MTGDDRADEREQDERPDDELAGRVGDPPQELAPPGPPERPDLEREAPLLDLGQRRQDDRPDERQDAAQPGAGRCPPCRGRGRAGRSRSTLRPLDHRRDGLERRERDEREPRRQAAPLEIEDEAPRLGRQPEEADRRRDREQPDERLGREVDALDRRVERADREQDVRRRPG